MRQFWWPWICCVLSGYLAFFSIAGRAQEATPKYTGKPLTLNFQTIEVRTALQIIADFTGLNVVASDSVTGSLSLRLHQVPWDQVLDIIAQTKGLSQRRQGNVIWIAPRAEVAARDKQEFEMQQALQNLEPLVTHNFVLNYAKAADVAQHIQGFGGLVGSTQATHGLGALPSDIENNAILYLSNKHPFGQYHSSSRPYDTPSMGTPHWVLCHRTSRTTPFFICQISTRSGNTIPRLDRTTRHLWVRHMPMHRSCRMGLARVMQVTEACKADYSAHGVVCWQNHEPTNCL